MVKKNNKCNQCEILEAELDIEKMKFKIWDRELSHHKKTTTDLKAIIKKQEAEIELLTEMIKIMGKTLEIASENTKKQIETMKKNTKEEF